MSAIPHHTAANSAGEPSDFAMAAGVRKIPSAIDWPVTTAIAAARPICLFGSIFPGSLPAYPAPSYPEKGRTVIHQKVEARNRDGLKPGSPPDATMLARFAAEILSGERSRTMVKPTSDTLLLVVDFAGTFIFAMEGGMAAAH